MNKKLSIIIPIILMSVFCLIPANKTNTISTTSNNYYASNTDIGTISYEKNTYNCTKGEIIDTIITAKSKKPAAVKSFGSTDKSIATVVKNPDYSVKCYNCLAVRITCKKSGKTTLTAKSTTGATTKAEVKVTNPTIKYEKSSYTCKAGQSFVTKITASGLSAVKSFKSSNTSVATIIKNPTIQVNCINCILVKVKCKKAGTSTLSAISTKGAKTAVKLTVKK